MNRSLTFAYRQPPNKQPVRQAACTLIYTHPTACQCCSSLRRSARYSLGFIDEEFKNTLLPSGSVTNGTSPALIRLFIREALAVMLFARAPAGPL